MADWFQIGTGVHQGCILSPCLFNLYAEYIMWNAGLNEAQTGIKIAGRNINNLRYTDDTILMAESEEELKSFLIKVKEESEKAGLKLLRVPWTARRSNQSILKEISPEYSLEGLMLKLKRQYFGHLMRRADSLEKTDAGKYWGQEEKGTTEGETIGWHHWLDGHELEQALEVGDGQGSLVCCSPWIAKSWTWLSN